MPRAERRAWTDDERLLALRLYLKIPFGRQHHTDPEVRALASRLGRTPSSVAMKLNNFTSVDPEERGRVKGLDAASKGDRALFEAYAADNEAVLERANALWEAGDPAPIAPEYTELTGPTTVMRTVPTRRLQRFVRERALANYEGRCCLTELPVEELLVASHIVPWAVDEKLRLKGGNVLLLARTQDAAFERGLWSLDDDGRVLVSPRLRRLARSAAVEQALLRYEGRALRGALRDEPLADAIRWHREHRFAS